uniref:Bax inhibitor 1 n=1 Tax=Rhabditophanes sp. KR3021 TaxID=114890 RepID=A0AC35TPD9_9BILA
MAPIPKWFRGRTSRHCTICFDDVPLAVITTIASIPFAVPDFQAFANNHFYLYWISLGIYLFLILTFIFTRKYRIKSPLNIISLVSFTLSHGFVTMMISTYYDTISVLLGIGMTTIICGFICLFSTQTKYTYFSSIGIISILSAMVLTFGITGVISTILFDVKWTLVAYAVAGSILSTLVMAHNTTILIGFAFFEITEDDYIFCAVQIFIGFVSIVFYLSLFIASCFCDIFECLNCTNLFKSKDRVEK